MLVSWILQQWWNRNARGQKNSATMKKDQIVHWTKTKKCVRGPSKANFLIELFLKCNVFESRGMGGENIISSTREHRSTPFLLPSSMMLTNSCLQRGLKCCANAEESRMVYGLLVGTVFWCFYCDRIKKCQTMIVVHLFWLLI